MKEHRRRWLLRGALVVPLVFLAHWAAYRAGAARGDAEPPAPAVAAIPRPPHKPAPPDPEMPSYPGAAAPDPLADSVAVQGVPMQLRQFATSDSVQEVVDHYTKVFSDRGYVVKSGRYPGGMGYVTYRPPERHDEVMNVAAMPYGTQTLVLFSRADPRQMLFHKEGKPADLPLPEGAEGTVGVDTVEGGQRSRVVMFSMDGKSAEEASLALRDTLLSAGWSAPEPAQRDNGKVVSHFVQGPRSITATLGPDPSGEAAMGLLTTNEPAPPPPPPQAAASSCPAPTTPTATTELKP